MNESSLKQLPPPDRRTEFQEKFGIVGESEGMRQVLETVEQVAPTNITVLVVGESGTGKELVAKAIHSKSQRKDKPLIIVNCAAIPEGILESELFGHERGSFTGAIGTRKGYFELADGGTIFLDEIGEMPPGTQVKLLRVLEGGEFMRVGSGETKKVDVRVIAATNKTLEKEVQKGNFREDLYYRLNAVHIRIPPLRERKKDIRILVRKFASDFCRTNNIEFAGFTETALKLMENHPWPGNVRELKNLVESMIVLEKGNQIDEYVLPKYLNHYHDTEKRLPVPVNKSPDQVERELLYGALLDLKGEIAQLRQIILEKLFPPRRLSGWVEKISPVYVPEGETEISSGWEVPNAEASDMSNGPTMQEMERELIRATLEKTRGNKRKAARMLKISERTLYRKIKEYNIPF